MQKRVDAFSRLSWRQRWIALLALSALIVVKASLASIGYRRTRSALGTLSPKPTRDCESSSSCIKQIDTLSWSVAGVSFHSPFTTTCLERTLTLWWLLRFRRIDSDIRIGTARSEGGLLAHAWLERNGVVVNDDADAIGQFLPFDRLR